MLQKKIMDLRNSELIFASFGQSLKNYKRYVFSMDEIIAKGSKFNFVASNHQIMLVKLTFADLLKMNFRLQTDKNYFC